MENKEENIPQQGYDPMKIENRDKYILRRMTQDTVKKIERNALEQQVGGKHYRECEIQPVEYIVKNNLDFLEGNIVKYVTRHRTKGEGRKDIEKVIHYAQLILEMHYD
jgi:hypothetical protein